MKLARNRPSGFVTFNPWGDMVQAYSAEGSLVWSHEADGIDDVWAADLNEDGLDEVIIGYNARGGLHVVDCAGKPLWSDNTLANVNSVTAGNVDGDPRLEVLATSVPGTVHVFNADGKHLRTLDPGIYCSTVRIWHNPGDAKGLDVIIVAGSDEEKQTLKSLTPEGKVRWSLDLPEDVVHMVTCPNAPWVALALSDGSVRVIDVQKGKEVAHATGLAFSSDKAVRSRRIMLLPSDIAWVIGGDGSVQLTAAAGSGMHSLSMAQSR